PRPTRWTHPRAPPRRPPADGPDRDPSGSADRTRRTNRWCPGSKDTGSAGCFLPPYRNLHTAASSISAYDTCRGRCRECTEILRAAFMKAASRTRDAARLEERGDPVSQAHAENRDDHE